MKAVKIKNTPVGVGHPCYIIGEIGINHNGDIEIAKKLIDAAAKAGCNAVKFQKRTIDVVYSQEELARPRENPFGTTNGDLKYGLEFGKDDYSQIDAYCQEKGIAWFASPWDEASVDFLDDFNVPCYKIASASLSDAGLLKHLRSKNKPLVMATGMSTLEQIDLAVSLLGKNDLIILHATSVYPAISEELNLSVIPELKKRYGALTGYSGHEMGIATSVAAVALGACVVERHITLDRSMWGSDQSASVEPHELAQLVADIRSVEAAIGDGVKRVLEKEISVLNKLRRVDTLSADSLSIEKIVVPEDSSQAIHSAETETAKRISV